MPDTIYITETRNHDVKGHSQRIFPKGTFVVVDKGYFDIALMDARCAANNHIVARIKYHTIYEVIS